MIESAAKSRPSKRSANDGNKNMKLDEFAGITQKIISEQGFDDFIPIACLPERRELRALADIEPGEETEVTVVEWARSLTESVEELLVVFKFSVSEFKVIRIEGTEEESAIYEVPCN
jgi:hypothetical protein